MDQAHEDGLSGIAWVSIVLAVIGALNWALVGLFDFNLVSAIFGPRTALSRIIYVLVGLAGLYLIYLASQLARRTRPRV
jgi:uncharacterized membrane protein YuzA (DUF378 family)